MQQDKMTHLDRNYLRAIISEFRERLRDVYSEEAILPDCIATKLKRLRTIDETTDKQDGRRSDK